MKGKDKIIYMISTMSQESSIAFKYMYLNFTLSKREREPQIHSKRNLILNAHDKKQ